MPTTKKCSKCGEEKPLNNQFFAKSSRSKSGYASWCKSCTRVYYEENRNRLLDYSIKYGKENRNLRRAWEQKNAEKIYRRRVANRDNVEHLKKQREYKNTDRFLLYLSLTKEKRDAYKLDWYRSNKGKYIVYANRRRTAKEALPATLTTDQWKTINKVFDNKCAYCGKEGELDQDHFVALSSGGEYTHNNIVPACKSCNRRKHNSDFFEWYPKQKFYSKKREQKILKFLNYKNGTQQLSLLI